MRTIALEEHYATPAVLDARAQNGPLGRGAFASLDAQLRDLDAGRLAAMDTAGIDVQVLSLLAPGAGATGARRGHRPDPRCERPARGRGAAASHALRGLRRAADSGTRGGRR